MSRTKIRMDGRILARRMRHQLPDRKERTAYYVTDLPPMVSSTLLQLQRQFVAKYGRDYGDDDEQFWQCPTQLQLDYFIRQLAHGMLKSNHHPAHIHAVVKTRKLIFGCGDCLDDCPKCNFRYVPEGWTLAWKAACEEAESWFKGGEAAKQGGLELLGE